MGLGAILGAAGSFLGGIVGNDQNRSLSHDMANRNSAEALAQRKWEERMSSTAHQRQVSDLEAAGLNPLLGISGNGSSTPGGASASSSAPTMENVADGAITSAIESKNLELAIKKQKEEVANLKSTNKNIEMNTNKTAADTLVSAREAELKAAETKRSHIEAERAKKDLPTSELRNDLYDLIRPAVKRLKRGVQDSNVFQNRR